jgi:hypothetical protein
MQQVSERGALARGHRDGPLPGTVLKTTVRWDASAAILLLRSISLSMLRSERASPVQDNSVLVVFKVTVLRNRVYRNKIKSSALRINLNIQGCTVVAPSLHAPSHAPLLLPLLLSHNIPLPRVH